MDKTAEIIETAEMPMLEELMVTDEMPMDAMVIVEEPHAAEEEKDFDWEKNKDLKKFLSYLQGKIGKIPQHSGKTTAGCERAIVYLKMLDKEISKAVGEDLDCNIDDQEVEKLRKEIRKMVKKLQKRHNEINDAYDADDGKMAADGSAELVKEADGEVLHCSKGCQKPFYTKDALSTHMAAEHGMAADDGKEKEAHACECQVKVADDNCPKCNIKLWKAADGIFECISCDEVFERNLTKEAGTARLTLVMTPFERAITGAIVNGFVSNGKNPEEIYAELKKKYKFTDRDELSIHQVLADMGYPILKDRGHLGDQSEELNKGKGIEFATQYNA